jgi:hypothetical protein
MKFLNLFILCCMAILAVACGGGGGGGGGYQPVSRVDSFVNLLNSRYAGPGTIYAVKGPDRTLTEDFVVVYVPNTGYVAYDIKSYSSGDSWSTYSTWAEYQEVYINRTEYDPFRGETMYYGDAYKNNLFGDYAGEFVFEEMKNVPKDLEKLGAVKEAYQNSKIAESLASEFGLSEERSQKIAKMANDWTKLSKSRSMTDADANNFTKELLGVSMADAEKAMKARNELGDEAPAYENLISAAADVNGIGMERTREVVDRILNGK